MGRIIPFRGLLYNQSKINDISRVAAPPYDVITGEESDNLHAASPYNIVRLMLGKNKPGDDEKNNRYTRASETFRNWIDNQILVYDDQPSFYLYRQEYYLEEQKKALTGIICSLKMDSSAGQAPVLPHEKTLDKPRNDRLELIRACRANLSPVFGLYRDSEDYIAGAVKNVLDEAPFIDFRDLKETTHRVWKLSDAGIMDKIREFIEPENIFIADGHHRYEAAFSFSREMAQHSPGSTGDEPYKFIMIYLSNVYDRGLTILPAHRLIRRFPEKAKSGFREKIAEYFTEEEFDDYDSLSKRMETAPCRSMPVFGLYYGGRFFLVTLRSFSKYESVLGDDLPPAYRKLDVCVAHNLIIGRILNHGKEMPQDNIDYEHNPGKAINLVDINERELAIFLNPTRIEQVLEIASSGGKMPGKATYFYPKPLCGLVIRKF